MANAGCINAIGFDGTFLRTLQNLDSANIGVGVQFCAPNPLDDKRLDYIKYTDKCGCTCCLRGENEILIYATQGVIKNFTLTNDDTNEVVNVKWNDLFGSNRAYTMVRYKTGSYPTSITDGTLAVKETTKNQYSSSGYNVSGLTDGTTYYFTAFAVSQDGTVIVVQNKTITPEYKRYKITANTVAYYPFKDLLDYSGNGYNLTNRGSAVLTKFGGIDCIQFPGANINSGVYNNNVNKLPQGGNATTISVRIYPTSFQTNEDDVRAFGPSGTTYNKAAQLYDLSPIQAGTWGNTLNAGINATLNARQNIIVTKNGTTWTIYRNGSKLKSGTMNTSISGSILSIGYSFRHLEGTSYFYHGYLKEFIMEDTLRNDAKSLAYYNGIKSKFGLA